MLRQRVALRDSAVVSSVPYILSCVVRTSHSMTHVVKCPLIRVITALDCWALPHGRW